MRMTVSLCVIMVEITNNLQLLPLIMLVLLISKVKTLQTFDSNSANVDSVLKMRHWSVPSDFRSCRLLVIFLMRGYMKSRPD